MGFQMEVSMGNLRRFQEHFYIRGESSILENSFKKLDQSF